MKKYKIIFEVILALGSMFFFNACASIPPKAEVVENFAINRYLGNWYEIARFDFRFEKDLDNTMAQYNLNEKGNVTVLNSGHNFKTDKWSSAEGIAKFRNEKDKAALKVSFFGPFYSGYNVIALDENYKYALVAGRSLDYLWILSREKTIPDEIKQEYLKIAQEVGFDISKFIWVKHDKISPFLKEK